MAVTNDDLVTQIVERTVALQKRLLGEYLTDAMANMKRETEALIRAEFGGEVGYLSKGVREKLVARDVEVMADLAAGKSVREVARRRNLSKSQVQRIKNRLHPAEMINDV